MDGKERIEKIKELKKEIGILDEKRKKLCSEIIKLKDEQIEFCKTDCKIIKTTVGDIANVSFGDDHAWIEYISLEGCRRKDLVTKEEAFRVMDLLGW